MPSPATLVHLSELPKTDRIIIPGVFSRLADTLAFAMVWAFAGKQTDFSGIVFSARDRFRHASPLRGRLRREGACLLFSVCTPWCRAG